MKVDNLLGPYLYQYKKLSLPGIGQFTLDDKAVLPDDNAKIKTPIEGIAFDAKTGTQLDDSLIQYVKDQTGKMKPLAEADLYSFIATAFQYLNIGKPFYFEGIGTLQKNKDNGYTFTAGTVLAQKTEEPSARYNETSRKSTYSNDKDAAGTGSFNAGRLLVMLGILVTLALIGWGGYYLYNKNTSETVQNDIKPATVPDTLVTTRAVPDSSGKMPDSIAARLPKDSAPALTAATGKDTTTAPVSSYKFILETTAKKARALNRYEQLKGVSMLKNYNNKVAMETKDSVSFTLYTLVPCTAADTAHVKDMLNAWYYGTKPMKVKIAQ